jgi:hypothetical protein
MEDVLGTLVTAAIAAVPALVISLFAWFKAKAANDGVQDWKDSVVATVEEVAADVIKKKTA